MKRVNVIILAITCGIFCVQVLGEKRSDAQRKIAAISSTKLLTPIYIRK